MGSEKIDGHNSQHIKELKMYHIWMEGFKITGGESKASYIGNADGRTFREAVLKWFEEHPNPQFCESSLSVWGCRLYPTETEARRSFG